jgi:uncharacterized protein YukE
VQEQVKGEREQLQEALKQAKAEVEQSAKLAQEAQVAAKSSEEQVGVWAQCC